MKKRQLGSSDLMVSELGLGCMSLGTDYVQAKSVIDQALDLGVNYLDTADLYDFGTNEEIIGKAIREKRQEIILATKVGNRWEEGKEGWYWDASKSYIKEEVKESLRRLGTDYIDLYQLHGGTMEDRIDETIEAFEDLKQEGVIRYYGISSIRPNVIREYVKKSSIISVMMQYSMFDRRPEEAVLPLLSEHHISVVARGPVAKGLLSENGTQKLESKFNGKGYLDYSYEELTSLLPDLKQVRSDHSLTESALQYCLHSPVVASVIAGASTVEQIKDNAKAVSGMPLIAAEYEQYQALTKSSVYEAHR
ncbi:aldo/keto reductase [Priestia koreensis]|uniref:aldo/keto reductase n=1 Tax=Priestia koreensis TaxID=284581 RepID=UPI0028F6C438|nr:aldo/keto reductase [Priestia koreensis]